MLRWGARAFFAQEDRPPPLIRGQRSISSCRSLGSPISAHVMTPTFLVGAQVDRHLREEALARGTYREVLPMAPNCAMARDGFAEVRVPNEIGRTSS
jgi:hypothetical protein